MIPAAFFAVRAASRREWLEAGVLLGAGGLAVVLTYFVRKSMNRAAESSE
jgi:hypothetical protein